MLIGHAGHPEVIGTMGQLPAGAVLLVEDAAAGRAAARCPIRDNLAYVTQTTLSVDDTAGSSPRCARRFPAIQGPKMEDICYATTNRQEAVKAIAARCDCAGGDRRAQLLQLHAPGRSGGEPGCREARLVQRAADMDWDWLAGDRGGSASPPAPRRPSCWSTS